MNLRSLRAFTLVEVMVALAVLSLGLTAAFGAMRSAAANSDHLYDVVLSHWAARDAAARIRLGLGAPAAGKAVLASETSYGRSYQVRSVFVPDSEDDESGPGEFRVTVSAAGAVTGESGVRFDARQD